jgi:hypothetical protein
MLKPTEFEFNYNNSVFRTFLVDTKWQVTVTHGADYFDRHQSFQLLKDANGKLSWSTMPYWRAAIAEQYDQSDDLDDLMSGGPGGMTVGQIANQDEKEPDTRVPASFDSAEEARSQVVLYLIAFARDHDDIWG